MRRLLERSFRASVPTAAAWAHLEKVEAWPSWASHIRRVELQPAGRLTPSSRGTIHLSNGIRSTFVVEELNPGVSWKWAGPFLWLTVHYDHRFSSQGPDTEIVFIVDAEGFLASWFGPLFAAVYKGNLERAIPNLIRELQAL